MFKKLFIITLIIFQVLTIQIFTGFSNNHVKELKNPERGPASGRPGGFTEESLKAIPNISLIYRYYYFNLPGKNPLSEEFINALKTDFAVLRKIGKKIIPRFAYSPSGDAPFDIVRANIIQLSKTLEENKDVIFTIQAGFIGKWGEWHSSNNNLNKTDVLNLILNHFPKNIQIQLRYPQDLMSMYGSNPTTESEALRMSTVKSRLGLHNDCFLYGDNDRGTFNRRLFSDQTKFFKEQSLYTVVGGERCGAGPSPGPEREKCPNALSELAAYHWTYLKFYKDSPDDQWEPFKKGGCVNEIIDRLGYQLFLRESSLSHRNYNILSNDSIEFTFKVLNKGFAAPVYHRPIRMVFTSGNEGFIIPIGGVSNLKLWLPEKEVLVKAVITKSQLENAVRGGVKSLNGKTFNLHLSLPDPSPSLMSNPLFSMGFANVGVYNSTSGLNNMFLTLKFSTTNTLIYEDSLFEDE